jgi:hypothetical protein
VCSDGDPAISYDGLVFTTMPVRRRRRKADTEVSMHYAGPPLFGDGAAGSPVIPCRRRGIGLFRVR